jgi:hypothetical protein
MDQPRLEEVRFTGANGRGTSGGNDLSPEIMLLEIVS